MSTETSLRPLFWKNYTLEQLTQPEWEALCDGCGLCCLVKLEDEDTHEVAYTKVACKLLDCSTGRCSDYSNRQQQVPDCLQLTPESLKTIHWLPSSCAYKRLNEGKNLPSWHYLNTGTRQSVVKAKKSVAGRCIPETDVHKDDLEDYVVRWVR
ncbi:YcgN family cysteine cluster protein [Acinetobacter nosocomialis]